MPKLVIHERHVVTLGGWIVENRTNLPYRDYVIGNPFNEPVKVETPIYSIEDIKTIEVLGLIVEPLAPYDRLIDKLNKVKFIIETIPTG